MGGGRGWEQGSGHFPGRSGNEESWHEGCGEVLDMGVTREMGFPGHGPEKRLEVQGQGTDSTGVW